MSGFVVNGSEKNKDYTISSNGFFPNVSTNEIRKAIRLDSSITDDRLIFAAENAVISVNRELRKLIDKTKKLADLSDEKINEKPVAEILYFRAVAAATGAEISERYRAYDTTSAGQNKSEQLEPTVDDYRRDLRFAIRDLKRIHRVNVELI